MRMYDVIAKKRDGGELSRDEIAFFIHGYVSGEIPDYQASALAMAMRCICPPDIWLGRLWSWFPSPTSSRACFARCRRSPLETPLMVNASSTLASTDWWGIRL